MNTNTTNTPANALEAEAAVQRIADFFEQLSPQDVARMAEFYTPDARFKDPFNEVQGLPEIERIFAHMFTALEQPRFVIKQRIVQGTQCFLVWDFLFAFKNFHKGVQQTVRGGSHLELADDGRITLHRDYWDAAEELYEKLPMVGALMRWLKRRANQS